jgi:hypothetical protein
MIVPCGECPVVKIHVQSTWPCCWPPQEATVEPSSHSPDHASGVVIPAEAGIQDLDPGSKSGVTV